MDLRLSIDALDPSAVNWKAVARRVNPPYFGRWFFHGVLGWPHRKLQRRAREALQNGYTKSRAA